MRKFILAVIAASALLASGLAGAYELSPPIVSASEFLSGVVQQVEKSKRALAAEDFPPISTYQLNGQAYWYMLPSEQCTYGGYPTVDELTVLLKDPSAPLLTEDGPLALIHCPDEDIIVRVEKGPYQELLQEYAAPDESTVERDGKVFSVTLSSWPLRNSYGYGGTVLSAAYVVATNIDDGIQLTHNGAEAFVTMTPQKLFELTGLSTEDLPCQAGAKVSLSLIALLNQASYSPEKTGDAYVSTSLKDLLQGKKVSLMIPLNREGYFPGETGDAYVSTLLRDLLQGKKVNIRDRAKPVSCNGGLYNVLSPVFSSGSDGSS
ncbi:MAG: hypothetical protein IPK84_04900 [Candidatus Moraniibacteriota bacterium]|nr:MAG: hypothetical protein IPK84_04900 [Candidatus Moranbacteria bacterium]